MQTFLPYPDFQRSMRCLDPSRLGNQCYREALTLISGGWKNHPASKMWRGYEHALANYALAGFDELSRRGRHYPHHVTTFKRYLREFPDNGMPPWLGLPEFHASHRAALLYKNYLWYKQFGWRDLPAIPDEKGRLPYVWPIDLMTI